MNSQNSPSSSSSTGASGLSGTASESGGTLAQTKNKITQGARDAASEVKAVASSTVAKAKDQAERLASEQKETAANRIGGYSSAIHDSARSLEEQDPNIAWVAHKAADKLQSIADYMRNRDFISLRDDCAGFARQHPAAFFGGMFLAGVLIGNVVKASQQKLQPKNTGYTPEGGMDFDSTSASGMGESFNAQTELTDAERTSAGL